MESSWNLEIGRRARGFLPVLLMLAWCANKANDGDEASLESSPTDSSSSPGGGNG